MKYTLLTWFFFFLLMMAAHAQHHDAVWLFGYEVSQPHPEFGGCVLEFGHEAPIAYKEALAMNFNVTGASICDSTGNLMLYTNGCYIANFAHLMVENGDSLNPGEITMNDCPGGLAIAQSHFFLPMPGHPGKYYLFHENLDYHDVLILARMPLYYSLIDMNENNGFGKVLEKNVSIFDYPDRTFGTMTAVKHANGQDWWVVFPEKSKNRFYRFRFSPNGVEDTLVQDLLPVYPNILSNAFTTFTPDGSKLARHEVTHGLYLYDFDRCTGLFGDNPLFIPLPGTSLGGGVSFSPDGRFVYLVSSTFILQADTWAADIAASLDTVAVYDGFTDTFGLATRFFGMQNGPDGRIYINTTNATRYLHAINYPNKKGDSCEVVQRAVELPTYNRFTSPHFPNYRLGPLDGSPCDTLGLDNHPLAGFRYAIDSSNSLRVIFTNNSFYQPTDWLWHFGDGSTSTFKDPLHKYDSPGTYLVCLTVSNAYDSDTFCREVTVDAPNATEESVIQAPAIAVWPNPARSGVVVELPQPSPRPVRLFLYDALGREVYRMVGRSGDRQLFFDVSGWAGGVYFGHLEGYGFFKVVVE